MTKERQHCQLIEYNDVDGEVVIYRIYPEGEKVLYTKIKLDEIPEFRDKDFSLFCKKFGEVLVYDCKLLRSNFDI